MADFACGKLVTFIYLACGIAAVALWVLDISEGLSPFEIVARAALVFCFPAYFPILVLAALHTESVGGQPCRRRRVQVRRVPRVPWPAAVTEESFADRD